MNEPKICKFCYGDKFIFHITFKIYNPETDEEEEINNVYECLECGSYNFEIEDSICWQLNKDIEKKSNTVNLANYMNS